MDSSSTSQDAAAESRTLVLGYFLQEICKRKKQTKPPKAYIEFAPKGWESCLSSEYNICPFFPYLEAQGALVNSSGVKRCCFPKEANSCEATGDVMQKDDLGLHLSRWHSSYGCHDALFRSHLSSLTWQSYNFCGTQKEMSKAHLHVVGLHRELLGWKDSSSDCMVDFSWDDQQRAWSGWNLSTSLPWASFLGYCHNSYSTC